MPEYVDLEAFADALAANGQDGEMLDFEPHDED